MKIRKILGRIASFLLALIIVLGVSLFFWGDRIKAWAVRLAESRPSGAVATQGFTPPESTKDTEAAPTFNAGAKPAKSEKAAEIQWPTESPGPAEIKIDVPPVPDEIKDPAEGGKK